MTREELAQKEREEFESVLSTPEGARFIAGLLDFCGVYMSSHSIGAESPLDTAFREGKRDVGLMLLGRIKERGGGELALLSAQSELRKRYEEALKNG